MTLTHQEKDLKTLLQSSLFQGVDKNNLDNFLKLGQWRNLQKGHILFHQGESAEKIYILTQGKIKLTQLNPDGNQIVLRILGPKQLIAIIAVLENTPYPATAQVIEKGLVFSLKQNDLLKLMKQESIVGINVMKILIHRIQELQDRFRELATQKVEVRLAQALLRLTKQIGKKSSEGIQIDLRLSRQDLAEITGSTLFTVSRLLTQWEKNGWIKSDQKKITVCKPDKLASCT